MADTGAPHFIPYVEPTDLVRDYPAADEAQADAVAAALTDANKAFDNVEFITATNVTFPVPSLVSPIVKVTVIGGGGGGGSGSNDLSQGNNGGNGGATTFDAGAAGTITAAGGIGGPRGLRNSPNGAVGHNGFASANGGQGGGYTSGRTEQSTGVSGTGGETVIAYLDLTGVATLNVAIGAGGAGGTGGARNGGDGGRGEVILEFKGA